MWSCLVDIHYMSHILKPAKVVKASFFVVLCFLRLFGLQTANNLTSSSQNTINHLTDNNSVFTEYYSVKWTNILAKLVTRISLLLLSSFPIYGFAAEFNSLIEVICGILQIKRCQRTVCFTRLSSTLLADGLMIPYEERALDACSLIPFMFSSFTTMVRKMKNPWYGGSIHG